MFFHRHPRQRHLPIVLVLHVLMQSFSCQYVFDNWDSPEEEASEESGTVRQSTHLQNPLSCSRNSGCNVSLPLANLPYIVRLFVAEPSANHDVNDEQLTQFALEEHSV